MNDSFLFKMRGNVESSDLPKLGELKLRVYPNGSKMVVQKNVVKSFCTVAMNEEITISVISGGYFCKSQTDTTPKNGNVDNSLSVVIAPEDGSYSKSDAINVYSLYFEDSSIELSISNKYMCGGLGMPFNQGTDKALYYNVDEIKYLTRWTRYSWLYKPVKISAQELPYKTISSEENATDGNYDNINIGDSSVNISATIRASRSRVHHNRCYGTINAIYSEGYVNLKGNFAFDLSRWYSTGGDRLNLDSPNVTGDIPRLISVIKIGSSNNLTDVTCNSQLASRSITTFEVHSNLFTLEMVKNATYNSLPTKSLLIESPLINTDEVRNDIGFIEKLNSHKSNYPNFTAVINGINVL